MKLTINVEKRYFFGLMIIGLVILGVVGVVAYNSAAVGGNPAVFGHSVDEIDWTKTIQGNVSVNGTINATRICIGNVCQTIWPLGGGGGADTRCDISGTCAQLCIGSDCRTSWPTGTGGVTKIIAGSGVTINPSSGVGEITISSTGGGGSLPTCTTNGQVLKWSGSAWGCSSDIDTDTKCSTSGTCSQVCIGTSCKTSWPVGVQSVTCPSGQAVIAISSSGVPTCGATAVAGGATPTLTWKSQCTTITVSGTPTCSTTNCGSYKIYERNGVKVCVGSTYYTPITSCTENAACTISGQYCIIGALYAGVYTSTSPCCGLDNPSLYSQTGVKLLKCS